MELYNGIVDNALVSLCEITRSTGDCFSQQENEEVRD